MVEPISELGLTNGYSFPLHQATLQCLSEQVSTRDFESENLATGQLRMISTGLAFILAPLENLARALDGVCVKSAFFAERDI